MHSTPRRPRNGGRGGHHRVSRRETNMWTLLNISKRDLSLQKSKLKLADLKPINSKWNKAPKALEGISAAKAKAVGLFSGPGSKLDPKLTSEDIKKFLSKNVQIEGKTIEDSVLTPLHSKMSKLVIIKGIDSEKEVIEDINQSFVTFLSNLNLQIPQEDQTLSTRIGKQGDVIVETKKSLIATILMSLNLKTLSNLGGPLILKRPHEYIQFDDPLYPTGELLDQITESPRLLCANSIPNDLNRDDVIKKLSAYGPLHSLVLLNNKGSDEKILFFEFRKGSIKSLNDLLNELKEKENISAFLACENTKNAYIQNIRLTNSNFKQIVNDQIPEISKHSETKMIQLLNMITIDDLISDKTYQQIIDILTKDFTTFEGFIELFIPRPDTKPATKDMQLNWGKVFVSFESSEQATKCLENLCGRTFCNRTVIGGYIDEQDFTRGII